MDKIQGYEIKKAVLFDNDRGVALGENPAAPAPYVTWRFTEDAGKRDYYWGHYHGDRAAAEKDFTARVADYKRLYGAQEVKRPIAELMREAQKLAGEQQTKPSQTRTWEREEH